MGKFWEKVTLLAMVAAVLVGCWVITLPTGTNYTPVPAEDDKVWHGGSGFYETEDNEAKWGARDTAAEVAADFALEAEAQELPVCTAALTEGWTPDVGPVCLAEDDPGWCEATGNC